MKKIEKNVIESILQYVNEARLIEGIEKIGTDLPNILKSQEIVTVNP